VAAAAASAAPDLDVIFICILQKKCEGCIARKQRQFQPTNGTRR
jgi:hypothetical protein